MDNIITGVGIGMLIGSVGVLLTYRLAEYIADQREEYEEYIAAKKDKARKEELNG